MGKLTDPGESVAGMVSCAYDANKMPYSEDILDIHQLAKSVQANRSKHSFDQVTFKDMSRFKNSRGHIKQFYECLILYKFLGRPSTDMELHSMDDFNKIPYVRGRDIPADKCALGFFPVRAKLPVGVTPSREIITMWAIDEYVKHLDSHFAYHCILHLATSKVEWTRVGDWFCNNCKMVVSSFLVYSTSSLISSYRAGQNVILVFTRAITKTKFPATS